MNEASEAMVDSVARFAESGEAFNYGDLCGKMTMRVVLKCAFGCAAGPARLRWPHSAATGLTACSRRIDVDTQTEGQEHEVISATKVFFSSSSFGARSLAVVLSLPHALRNFARAVMFYTMDVSRLEHARDVLFSISNQLSVAYAKAAGLPPFKVDPEILGKGVGLRVLSDDVVPSKNSIIAAMMHAKNRYGG